MTTRIITRDDRCRLAAEPPHAFPGTQPDDPTTARKRTTTVPSPRKFVSLFRPVATWVFVCLSVLLSGCGSGISTSGSSATLTPYTYSGRIMGGQQPVAGASINLYAVTLYNPAVAGSSPSMAGYGLAVNPLLISPVTTDAQGRFSITGLYQCVPDYLSYQTGDLVYITATGGNPGLASNNNSLMLMTAGLGPCNTQAYSPTLGYVRELSQTAFIHINELTTVASVYALSAFMTGPTNLGAPRTNLLGLQQAFADVGQLVDTTTGFSPGPALPAGATFPTAEINTLANILAACVNSTGPAATGPSACGTLFAAATPPGGMPPADTLTAILNIAHNPGLNVAPLFALSSASAPFQPALALPPNDWTLAVDYSAGVIANPSSLAVDASGNVWIASTSSSSVAELTHAGQPAVGSPFQASIRAPAVVALDQNGIPWVAGSDNTVDAINPRGAPAVFTGGGLNSPSAIAFDPQGNLWVANGGANSVSAFNSAGSPLSASGTTATGIVKPLGIAISPH